MMLYGGYIQAQREGVMTTFPIVLRVASIKEAQFSAEAAAQLRFPVEAGYTDVSAEVIALEDEDAAT